MWMVMTCAKQTHTFFIFIPIEPIRVRTHQAAVQCATSEIVRATGECVYTRCLKVSGKVFHVPPSTNVKIPSRAGYNLCPLSLILLA